MTHQRIDTLLIGGGIISVTLASLIHQLDSSRQLMLVEQADRLAPGHSDPLDNAGTGHAGFCEMNYDAQGADNNAAVERAVSVNMAFGQSLAYWANLVHRGWLPQPNRFIRRVPHINWATGEAAVGALWEWRRALSGHPLFASMEWTQNPVELARWMPLILSGRRKWGLMAATRVAEGADIDSSALTRLLGESLQARNALDVRLDHRVVNLVRKDNEWLVTLAPGQSGELIKVRARTVFVGAGGAALSLLQKAGVEEAKDFAGFPVSGLWLTNRDELLAKRHGAKVHSPAPVGAPPISVPHLDTQVRNGRATLQFGPFRGFGTHFLGAGHYDDFMNTLNFHNVRTLLDVGLSQRPLTRHLFKESTASQEDRLAALETFLPGLDPDSWTLESTGQQMQIVKRNGEGRGVLEFDTEVVASEDGSISGLLGGSLGASASVTAVLEVLERCFPELCQGSSAQQLQSLVPSWGMPHKAQVRELATSRDQHLKTLGLLPQTLTSVVLARQSQTGDHFGVPL